MATPPPTTPDTCPRCGGGFACGANAGHCDCFGIRLGEPLRVQLARDYPGQCLCLRCLRELVEAHDRRPAGSSQA